MLGFDIYYLHCKHKLFEKLKNVVPGLKRPDFDLFNLKNLLTQRKKDFPISMQ